MMPGILQNKGSVARTMERDTEPADGGEETETETSNTNTENGGGGE